MKKINSDRKVYMAITKDVYKEFFQRPSIKEMIVDENIYLLIFDKDTEEIVQWIS